MAAVADLSFDEMAVALSYVYLAVGSAVPAPAAPGAPASTGRNLNASRPETSKPPVPSPVPAKESSAPTESPAPSADNSAPPAESQPEPAVKAEVAKPADDDEVDDLFGDDDAEEAPPAKEESRAEKMAAAKAAKAKSKKIDKSQIVFEVKPWDAEQDLNALFGKIRQVELEGLTWGEACKLVPVAFGVKKLVLSVVVEDEKVGVQDVEDIITGFEDEVQSVDMTTMNRL